MAATFNAPLASVLLAVELLLFEWRPRSYLPVAASSAPRSGRWKRTCSRSWRRGSGH